MWYDLLDIVLIHKGEQETTTENLSWQMYNKGCSALSIYLTGRSISISRVGSCDT
jgi:hypothetical protein